ncbi:uncharacterized protein [Linepithema humile]
MENSKVVNLHGVLGGNKEPTLFERCLKAFMHSVARKCETTIVLKTYVPRDAGNTSFVDNNSIVRRAIERSLIWKIAGSSGDALVSPAPSSASERIHARNVKAFGGNTWNVHVILTSDTRSLEQISKNGSTFEWNAQDRFIVLIARCESHGPLSVESYSKIDDVLRTLWSERKMYRVSVSETILVNDTIPINQVVRTYNPFAKVNDSAWGKIEITNVETAEETASMLSRSAHRWTSNMNEYKLKVGMFTQGQTVEKENESSSQSRSDVFKELDEIMLKTISQQMNFTAKIMDPTDNLWFGYQLSNGTYTGALGDVVHGRADIYFESFFVKKYSINLQRAEDVDFSVYFDFDRLCVVVPKAHKVPKWLRIYHFFPLSIWIGTTLTYIVMCVMWCFLQTFTPGRKERVGFRATVYRSFLLNAGCPQKLPDTNAERILLSGIFLANVTLVGIFSGILYNSFAHDMYYPDIDSLQDLDASRLPLLLTSISLTDIFGSGNESDTTPVMKSLRKKLEYGENSVKKIAAYRNVSGFIRKNHQPIFNEEFIDEDGSPLLHLVQECPGAFYLSYLLPINSILRERLNTLIGRLNQAGLPMLWENHVTAELIASKRLLAKKKLTHHENGFVPFNLSDVQSSFYMLLMGLSVAIIAFFHERGWLKTALLHVGKLSSKSMR